MPAPVAPVVLLAELDSDLMGRQHSEILARTTQEQASPSIPRGPVDATD